jgi:tRNA1(Val) A37 N6-methylase TrmN6
MSEIFNPETETLDDLMCGYELIQTKSGFRFSLDAVLLAHFTGMEKNDIAADFCSGSGVIAFLALAHKSPSKVTCIEIQEDLCMLIDRSTRLNSVQDKISAVCANIEHAHEILGYETQDTVMCNPPYLKVDTGKTSGDHALNLAKREVEMSLEGAVSAASKVLKNKGKFSIVHIARRADELFSLLAKYNLPVKRARLVQPDQDKEPNLILAEGVKNSSQGIKWLPSLCIYENGQYTKELKEIYGIE